MGDSHRGWDAAMEDVTVDRHEFQSGFVGASAVFTLVAACQDHQGYQDNQEYPRARL